jgi:hypothetical protein
MRPMPAFSFRGHSDFAAIPKLRWAGGPLARRSPDSSAQHGKRPVDPTSCGG